MEQGVKQPPFHPISVYWHLFYFPFSPPAKVCEKAADDGPECLGLYHTYKKTQVEPPASGFGLASPVSCVHLDGEMVDGSFRFLFFHSAK